MHRPDDYYYYWRCNGYDTNVVHRLEMIPVNNGWVSRHERCVAYNFVRHVRNDSGTSGGGLGGDASDSGTSQYLFG